MSEIKQRNVVLVWLVWPVITLGIYYFVWLGMTHAEMRRQTRDQSQPVAGVVLVQLLIGWLVIP